MSTFSSRLKDIFPTLETPFYYYDMELLKETLSAVVAAAKPYNFHIHYALKANFNDRILDEICAAGLGADCVAGNEVKKAVEKGFAPEKIVFAGVGKSDKEIEYALDQNIFAFNVESLQELSVINELASKKGKKAAVSIRINPNVDAQTHHYITTGLDENKFGILQDDLMACVKLVEQSPNIELIGIHFHVGSQITDLNVFKSLCVKANEINDWFDERGIRLKVINVGGGLGIDYQHPDEHPIPDFQAYFDVFNRFLNLKDKQEVHFELGRSLVAQCGSLFSRVLYVKTGIKKNFLILDAGMTELMRPALYQAYHKIEKFTTEAGSEAECEDVRYDVVGPICESSDCFGKEVLLPAAQRGDGIVIRSAGAYGEVMSSRYNLRDEIRYVYSDLI
jgi:diaminopimelate decarboxylase